jgi:AcrR family transcriptional regulator
VSPTQRDSEPTSQKSGWWGSDTALTDDEEARRRLVAAAMRCLVRRRSARFPIDEVAAEAGVARSTVYRYFRSRDDLVLGVILSRADAGMARMVAALRDPRDAASSFTDLIVLSLEMIRNDPVNSAIYLDDSRSMTAAAMTSEPLVDVLVRHVGPLLEQWRAEGQVHRDLDVRETLDWTNTMTVALLGPPWSGRSLDEIRGFVERYLVRALVVPGAAPASEG